jgi:hypothetical protein
MKPMLFSTRLFLVFICSFSLLSFKCGSTTAIEENADTKAPSQRQFDLITEKQFNELFPQRDKFYTYAAFMQAVNELGNIKVKVSRRALSVYQIVRTDKKTGKESIVRQDIDWNEPWAKVKPDSIFTVDYGDFCTVTDSLTNKKELAAFFAHIAHETRHGENGTYTDGLMLRHEANTSLEYYGESDEYPPVKGKKYYGRGPMQLSYNGNYGKASDCIFGDKIVLLNDPDKVENDAVVAFKVAIWFWMMPETHKPSAHDVMIGKWRPNAVDKTKGRTPGFGMTINIINGAVECNKGENEGMNDRIGFYQHFLSKLGVTDANCACSCGNMQFYTYSN